MFQTSDFDEIRSGKVTDVYFDRTLKILKAKGLDKEVKAEFIAKELPNDWPFAILAGVEEVAALTKGMPVTIRMMEEGSIFYPFEPVMEIGGMYTSFGVYETALLGLICQASGIATQSARFKKLAGERLLLSFGARRMHPVLAPMIERNAFVGGCDGVSVVKAAELIEADPTGTMPHALILIFGDTVKATVAFDEVMEPSIRRVSLIDTFNDEKFEALRVAEALNQKLWGVRFDTPSSRRGNFYRILEEARWELDSRGYNHIKFVVSGGIKEKHLPELNPLVDAYGIGTSISNAPVVDVAMDIMEIEGKPFAKRGKWSGRKSVVRCNRCDFHDILPYFEGEKACACGGKLRDILVPLIVDGKRVRELKKPKAIREFVMEQMKKQEVTPVL